jgi:hypothetical protein
MQAFKDKAGRDWNIEITTGTVKRLRGILKQSDGETPLSLVDAAVGGEYIYRVFNDSSAWSDLIWALLQPQAKEKGITQEQFDAGMYDAGESPAWKAFTEELADFTQPPRREMVIENVKMVLAATEKAIQGAKVEMLKRLSQMQSTGAAGPSPESSDATPVT